MATLANGTIPLTSMTTRSSHSSPSIVTSPGSSTCSTAPSTCENGVILNGNSHSSSLNISSTILSATKSAANVMQTAVSTSTHTSSIHCGMPSTSILSTAAKAPVTSLSGCKTASAATITCTTLLPSTSAVTASTPSAHQLLLNGLNIIDTDLGVVNPSSLTEDPRALQLALELSMVGLSDSVQLQVQPQQQLQQLQQQHLQNIQHQQQHHHHQKQIHQQKQHKSNLLAFDISAVAAAAGAMNVPNTQISNSAAQLNQFSATLLPGIDDRAKKSQNMTECVPVPSSEHVAEIVGRQGCKIKALRAKTNTYIKTPVRGEEPVFVVTGRKEDVAKAKREILSAAEHFSVIRASRKPSFACNLTGGNLNGSGGGCSKTPPGPPLVPGHVTIQVRVPYRVVGLVVGSKGATIKHIQQETQTYIVTPSREKEPIFDVSGLPDNVQAARKQIEAHIAMRTGAPAGDENSVVVNNGTVHTINSLSQILNDDISPELLASIYKNGLSSTFNYSVGAEDNEAVTFGLPAHNICVNSGSYNSGSESLIHATVSNSNNFQLLNRGCEFLNGIMSTGTFDDSNTHHMFSGGVNLNTRNSSVLGSTKHTTNLNENISATSATIGNGMSRSCSSASSTTSSKSTNNSGGSISSRPELSNIWKNLSDSLDVDEGIGESPNMCTLPPGILNTNGTHYSSSTTSISPTDSLLRESNTFGQLIAMQTQQQQQRELITNDNSNNCKTNNLIAMQQQQQIILQQNQQLALRRECLICNEKEVTAALVPCGHNMFCMECANRICASLDGVCPACSQSVFHAMRILP